VAIKIIDLEKYDNESIVDIKVRACPERNIYHELMRPQKRHQILRVILSGRHCLAGYANI
jgi:hypothetical protein